MRAPRFSHHHVIRHRHPSPSSSNIFAEEQCYSAEITCPRSVVYKCLNWACTAVYYDGKITFCPRMRSLCVTLFFTSAPRHSCLLMLQGLDGWVLTDPKQDEAFHFLWGGTYKRDSSLSSWMTSSPWVDSDKHCSVNFFSSSELRFNSREVNHMGSI